MVFLIIGSQPVSVCAKSFGSRVSSLFISVILFVAAQRMVPIERIV